MELELLDYSIEQLDWGERSVFAAKSLRIARSDVEALLNEWNHGIDIDFELVRPGESKRIVHVLDTVLPIAKHPGGAAAFPGFAGPAQLVGNGQTIRIKNMLVTVAGRFPDF